MVKFSIINYKTEYFIFHIGFWINRNYNKTNIIFQGIHETIIYAHAELFLV